MSVSTTKFPARNAVSRSLSPRRPAPKEPRPRPSDDEILGLVTAVPSPAASAASVGDAPQAENVSVASAFRPADAPDDAGTSPESAAAPPLPPALAQFLDAHPPLRQIFDEAQAYRSVFASPAAARDAKNQLDELDAMFFSAHPADHAALAARLRELSPEAFQSFARAAAAHAASAAPSPSASPASRAATPEYDSRPADASPGYAQGSSLDEEKGSASSLDAMHPGGAQTSMASAAYVPAPENSAAPAPRASSPAPQSPTANFDAAHRAARLVFFHATNAAAVEHVLGAIQSQVDRLLPDSIPASARQRIVGEIYRDLDSALRSNRQLGAQLRDAFHSGAGDAAHQRSIVALVAGRARQALPSIAKRVIGEWTQTILAANRQRLSRHEAAAHRVDIAGAGSSDGVQRKPLSPRDLNYRRLSDADILNL